MVFSLVKSRSRYEPTVTDPQPLLSCDVHQVTGYERYSFEPVSVRNKQIVMVIADPPEETLTLDSVQLQLQQQPTSLHEQMAEASRSTERAIEQASKAMKKLRRQRKQKRSSTCSSDLQGGKNF